jgi:hypothetical protein
MKSAAKRDMSCESQNSANHAILERIRRSRVFPGACPSERRSQKSTPLTIKTREERGRSGVCRDAVSWERGAPALAPSYDEGSGAKASVESASGCKLTSGALARIHPTLVDLGISSGEDGRRPWSVRPGSEGLRTLPSLTTTSDRAGNTYIPLYEGLIGTMLKACPLQILSGYGVLGAVLGIQGLKDTRNAPRLVTEQGKGCA